MAGGNQRQIQNPVKRLRWRFFCDVVTGFRGKLRILSNIQDGAFLKKQSKDKSRLLFVQKPPSWMFGKFLKKLLNWRPKLKDVSLLHQSEYQRCQIILYQVKSKRKNQTNFKVVERKCQKMKMSTEKYSEPSQTSKVEYFCVSS